MGAKQSKAKGIWFRHSGQPAVDGIPLLQKETHRNYKNDEEMVNIIGSHHITHMCVYEVDVPTLNVIAPRVTVLKIVGESGNKRKSSELGSLKSLTELKELSIQGYDLSDGLPAGILQSSSLENLDLINCKLNDFPQSFETLKSLKKLNISSNDFKALPLATYKLQSLRSIDFSHNKELDKLDDKLLDLENLEVLNCDACESLATPPFLVCMQGLPAVKKYFQDLKSDRNLKDRVVSVAFVGKALSGKTSVIQSLQANETVHTSRNENPTLNEAEGVLRSDGIILENCRAKLLEYGNHSVCNIPYDLVINEQCVPVIVVNMEQFAQLSQSRGPKEATRRLCIDWLTNLYVTSPRLGPPILVLTHTGNLKDDQLEQRKDELLINAQIIREQIALEEEESSASEVAPIPHFSNKKLPLFHPDEVFEFSDITTEIAEQMKQCINNRGKEFANEIPRLWESVEEYIENFTTAPYVMFSDVAKKFSEDDPSVILRYLHNSGKILWFEKPELLSDYIFHQIPAITNLISLLLKYSSDDPWKKLIAEFSGFRYNQQDIDTQYFQQLVDEFKMSGEMDQVLLIYLFETSSKFPAEVAIQLLQHFYIVHGPIKREHGNTYIFPSLSTNFLDKAWKTDGYLQLRLEIQLKGLPVPKYAFQLATVAVLNHTVGSNTTVKVAKNGATIRHGESATHVVHNCNSRNIMLQVSTSAEELGQSWKLLLQNARAVHSLFSKEWKACRSEMLVYCAHCLFLKDQDPACDVKSHWFHSANLEDILTPYTSSAMELTECSHSEFQADRLKSTVPQALVKPCFQLKSSEIKNLKTYLQTLESEQMTNFQEEVPAPVQQVIQDEDSDLSDVEGEGYCDGDRADMKMRVKKVTKKDIKLLYDNTERVYQMSDGTRGRVLIFNINSFSDNKYTRESSEIDHRNISRLFNDLRFDIVKSQKKPTDLTEQEIYNEIERETRTVEHKNLGMFVMVILSHGGGDVILDCHRKEIPLTNILDLFSPLKFPAMKGKPKLFIILTSSVEHPVSEDSKEVPHVRLGTPTARLSGASADPPHPTHPEVNKGFSPIPSVIRSDDFFVIKATRESYLATRSIPLGSWFIRVFVATFYKHSHHRDFETLFKIVQFRVRQVSLSARPPTADSYCSANVPSSICTFTNDRNLYLFPGCSLRGGSRCYRPTALNAKTEDPQVKIQRWKEELQTMASQQDETVKMELSMLRMSAEDRDLRELMDRVDQLEGMMKSFFYMCTEQQKLYTEWKIQEAENKEDLAGLKQQLKKKEQDIAELQMRVSEQAEEIQGKQDKTQETVCPADSCRSPVMVEDRPPTPPGEAVVDEHIDGGIEETG